jgi:hypothetical protein
VRPVIMAKQPDTATAPATPAALLAALTDLVNEVRAVNEHLAAIASELKCANDRADAER